MQLPRLELTNTMTQIGIEQQRATVSMRQPKADVKMNQPQPDVEYIKTKSQLEIDQTVAFADANLKHPFRMVREAAARARQDVLKGLAEEAAEGDRLMKIEYHNQNVIQQIAREESEPTPKQFNIGFMPSSAGKVKIFYQPSSIEIKVNRGNFNIDITPNYPTIKFNPGDLQIYLKQKASLQIQAVGANLNQII